MVAGMAAERLFSRQVLRATRPDGSVDLDQLRHLVVACYEDAARDRERTDRAITLMAEELEGANRRLEALVENLRVQNLRFEAALDNMLQGLCLYDRQDRLVVVNRRYHEILGLGRGALRPGISHAEQLSIEQASGLHRGADLQELLATRIALVDGRDGPARAEIFTDDRRRLDVAAQRLASGGCIVTVMDVTAERAAEARAAAAGRLTSLGEMAAGLAHELKQPLTAIALAAANASRAAERGDTSAVLVRLGRIADQAARGGVLIDHLRRFARGGEGGDANATAALPAAVEGALTLIGGALREASIEVALHLPPGLPPVRGDSMALEQVLLNLLANARDALGIRDSGACIGIAARQAEDGRVELDVSDNAGGIPDAVMSRLFQPFVTTKGPDRGTGLGLSICHGLVTSMGGTIEAENGAEGAIFRIALEPALD
ncbi:PAS-domain containing protein [Falsiroseomonas stagni]|uniref:histidine kinase n=1 Tax=Falsiroseomonas stagni DSM 19981 TaxID=1123062 RepID=A0A1I3Z905_9PROT|nr:PAS-domain containing protein [Falsiroseomonas stagni]SFK40400.1 His Kinase A (phospho-acceptor) domain-containing protein [Falsiroseomonas stagni DSM 19981]